MILERVRVQSWGPLRWPVELTFHPRVNLIHAPNESGKSSLITAIRYALLEPVTAKVDAYRPWGSQTSPQLTVDFRTAAARWRVEKAYGRRPEARLLRERRGAWEPVADDPDTVHAQTVAVVTGAEVAGRRRGRESEEARLARRGVLYVLWREQGTKPLEGLDLPGTAERDLAEAVGAAVVSDRDRRLIELAEKRAAELLTAKRREETGALAEARKRVETARATLVACREQVRLLREWEERAESAVGLFAETDGLLNDARAELKRLEQVRQQARERAGALPQAKERLQMAERACSTAAKQWEDLIAARTALRAAREARERKAAVVAARREAAGTIEVELGQADAQTDAIEAAAAETRAAAELARARLDLARGLAERDAVTGRIDRAKPLEAELAAARERRRAITAPDDEVLTELHKLQRSVDVEAAKLAAGRFRVILQAERPLWAEADVDGAAAAAEVGADDQVRWDALERAEVRLAGVGTFRVERELETSLARQREKVGKLQAQRAEQLAGWGAASVAALEERAAAAQRYDETIRRVEATLDALRPEGREAAADALAQAAARIDGIREQHPDLAAAAPAIAAAEAGEEAVRKEAARRDGELQHHRDHVASLRKQLRTAEADLPALEAELQDSDREVERLTGRVGTLEEDGLTDEERSAGLAALEADKQAAQAEVERLGAAAADADAAERAFAAGEREVATLEATREGCRNDLTTARARAAAITEAGSYSDLVRAEEAVQAAESAYAALRLRADARDLLVRTLVAERDSQRAQLFQPVGDRAGHLMARVSGGRYAAIRLEGALRPAGVIPEDYPDEAPPLDALSGGAQEQLGTVIRLALGEVLVGADPGDGQTIVLDEPLPHSDPVRRRRMIEILSDPAQGLQIIVLANDARDYAALRRDEEHDLLRLLEASREAAAAR